MPIRFPTEAANDPGQPGGMPASTSDDDRKQAADRGLATDRQPLRERGTRETSRDDAQRDSDSATRDR